MSYIEYSNFTSENINKLFYNEQLNQLIVEYKSGGQYRYNEVSINEWNELISAESKGKFINESIKSKPYQKMVLSD